MWQQQLQLSIQHSTKLFVHQEYIYLSQCTPPHADRPSLPLWIKFCPTVKSSSGSWFIWSLSVLTLCHQTHQSSPGFSVICQVVHPASVTFGSTLRPHSRLWLIPYTSKISFNLTVLSVSAAKEPQTHTLGVNMNKTTPNSIFNSGLIIMEFYVVFSHRKKGWRFQLLSALFFNNVQT